MKAALLVCLLFALAFASDVVVLDDSNFSDYVNENSNSLVKFYAPWCGHCKTLAPEYEIAATAFKKYSKDVSIAEVDCTISADLCSRYGVTGYPTLKFFAKGKSEPQAYSGERKAGSLIDYVNSQVGLKARAPGKAPSSVVELTPANFDKVVNKDSNVFVKFFAPWCGHCKRLEPDYEKFAAVFQNEKDVVVARIDCAEHGTFCSDKGIQGYPTLKWYAKGSSQPQDYDEERDLENLVDFVNKNAGTKRLISGSLGEDAGLIEEFNDLVEEFFSGDKTVALNKAKEAVEKLGAEATLEAKTYLRAFEKLITDPEYAKKELTRLKNVLKGSLQATKIDEFTKRVNILSKFSRD